MRLHSNTWLHDALSAQQPIMRTGCEILPHMAHSPNWRHYYHLSRSAFRILKIFSMIEISLIRHCVEARIILLKWIWKTYGWFSWLIIASSSNFNFKKQSVTFRLYLSWMDNGFNTEWRLSFSCFTQSSGHVNWIIARLFIYFSQLSTFYCDILTAETYFIFLMDIE